MSDKKELTVSAEELSKDPATKIVEEVPVVEDNGETLLEKEGDKVAPEIVESGIGLGFVTGFKNGASAGIAGEEDFRSHTVQAKSQ